MDKNQDGIESSLLNGSSLANISLEIVHSLKVFEELIKVWQGNQFDSLIK